jgi:flap endonuclease-1
MGVNLTPIILKEVIDLSDLRGKSLAIDANNYLYQFLALIRKPDGTPLQDSNGNITSHLVGLTYRSTRLIHEYNIKLIFIFDGKPPSLKEPEIKRRRELRKKAIDEWKEAQIKGDYSTAFSKAVMTSRLTKSMLSDAKFLLNLLGIPYIQALSEAEAQCAYLTQKSQVWAVSSKDYDSILFGASRLLRFLTISGREYLPSKGISRPLIPEIIELDQILNYWKINREEAIDMAIMIGTDFNEGLKGIGPKKALNLVREFRRIEDLPYDKRRVLESQNYKEVRKVFLQPEIEEDYSINYGDFQEDLIYNFLCEQRNFTKERVKVAIERMKNFYSKKEQTHLEEWLE